MTHAFGTGSRGGNLADGTRVPGLGRGSIGVFSPFCGGGQTGVIGKLEKAAAGVPRAEITSGGVAR